MFNIQHYSIQDGPGIRTTVFFKGCPLTCLWCSNPESQNLSPEVAHSDSLCNECGRCVEVCEVGAIGISNSRIEINRDTCNTCGKCIEVCSPGALKIYGRQTTLEEVLTEVRKETLFYWNSGGGVTASGGEPLSQSEFVSELFRYCQRSGIHTALDTCGFARSEALKRVLRYTDLVLYDLKIFDPTAHRKLTGHSNKRILDNARIIAADGIPTIIRIPLIPDINDSEDNMRAIAGFIVDLKNVIEINILPYHRFGTSKYQMLDRDYQLSELRTPSQENVREIKTFFESYGLKCKVIE